MTVTRAHRIAAIVAAAARTAGASACTAASADPNAAAPAHSTRTATVLHFVSVPEKGNMVVVDLGPKSKPDVLDISDVIAFTERLTRGGKPAGQLHVAAIGVDHKRMLSQATGTMTLHGGTVAIAGTVPKTPRFRLAVVGGTGSYVGASGTLLLDFTGKHERLTLTVRR